jgi:hypothetical protein
MLPCLVETPTSNLKDALFETFSNTQTLKDMISPKSTKLVVILKVIIIANSETQGRGWLPDVVGPKLISKDKIQEIVLLILALVSSSCVSDDNMLDALRVAWDDKTLYNDYVEAAVHKHLRPEDANDRRHTQHLVEDICSAFRNPSSLIEVQREYAGFMTQKRHCNRWRKKRCRCKRVSFWGFLKFSSQADRWLLPGAIFRHQATTDQTTCR